MWQTLENEDPDLWFHVDLDHNATFIFTLYRSQCDAKVMLDRISEDFDNITVECSLATFHICDDLKTHYKQWFVYTYKTDEQFRYFTVAYEFAQVIEKSTRIPDVNEHDADSLISHSHSTQKNDSL